MVTPRPSRRRRKLQWWRPLASPFVMLLAAPVLLAPVTVLVLLEMPTPPTPIEVAIGALPSVDHSSTADTATLQGGRLPNNLTSSLYANSAAAAAASLGRADTNARPDTQDYASVEYGALHPQRMARDDFLVGQLAMIYSTPLTMDLSLQLFQEFCNAQPGDAFYGIPLDRLPIDPALLRGLVRYSSSNKGTGLSCARL